MAQCRCLHSFCDACASVSCSDEDINFSACSFCPGCAVKCEVLDYHDASSLDRDGHLQYNHRDGEVAEVGDEEEAPQSQPVPPNEFLCPITHELMDDPVVLTDGFSYNRVAIIQWLTLRMVSPITGGAVANALMPNTVLKVMINDWKERNNYVPA